MTAHHLSRKFLLAVFIVSVSSVALFIDKLTGGAWVAVSTLVISSYGAADVTQQTLAKKTEAANGDS